MTVRFMALATKLLRGPRKRHALAALVAVVGLMVFGLPAASASTTTIGSTFTGGTSVFPPPTTYVQRSTDATSPSYTVPTGGATITSFSVQANADTGDQVKFKVFRPGVGPDQYTVIGSSATQTLVANMLNTFVVGISVQPGDVIGITAIAGAPPVAKPGFATGDQANEASGDFAVSSAYNPVSPSGPGWRLNVSAVVDTGAGRSTSTAVSCTPASVLVGDPSTCTATVDDTLATGTKTAPAGPMSFSTDGAGAFGGAGQCNLAPTATPGESSCSLSYTPSDAGSGTHTISASYSGDSVHNSSNGNTTVAVSTPVAGNPGGAGTPTTTTPTPTPIVIADHTPPGVTGYAMGSQFKAATSGGSVATAVGTHVSFRLTEAASMRFSVVKDLPGRKVGRRCVAPSRSNRHKVRCTRTVGVGSFALVGHPGANSFRFTGRVRGRKLAPTKYRLVETAKDAAGNVSLPQSRSFAIVSH
jgi:hypothetical protein